MEYLKLGLVGILTILIAYCTLCFFSPPHVATSNSIIINSPAPTVYTDLVDLRNWPKWHQQLDSTVVLQLNHKNDRIIQWKTKDMSNGSVEINDTAINTRISYIQTLVSNGKTKTGQYEFLLEANGSATKLSWVYVGPEFHFLKRPANYAIKEFINQFMERNLLRLKRTVEMK